MGKYAGFFSWLPVEVLGSYVMNRMPDASIFLNCFQFQALLLLLLLLLTFSCAYSYSETHSVGQNTNSCGSLVRGSSSTVKICPLKLQSGVFCICRVCECLYIHTFSTSCLTDEKQLLFRFPFHSYQTDL